MPECATSSFLFSNAFPFSMHAVESLTAGLRNLVSPLVGEPSHGYLWLADRFPATAERFSVWRIHAVSFWGEERDLALAYDASRNLFSYPEDSGWSNSAHPLRAVESAECFLERIAAERTQEMERHALSMISAGVSLKNAVRDLQGIILENPSRLGPVETDFERYRSVYATINRNH
jgi:hypothetical protein